ncbi:TenA family transcriptional regulator [Streptomyces cinnamoneus]|uniref:TenA family transcriptional regulator n=1 Tax=Streptomyces cinnamoneus TaxID=53446 RepID=UPI00378EDB96
MQRNRYAEALEEIAPVLKEDVETHPFITDIVGGRLTPSVYAAYLRETYHLVHQTPCFLTAAAAHTRETWLQDWFIDLAVDERHHDRLCVRDLRNLGLDPDAYLRGLPGLGTWTMVGQNHYLTAMGDPAGILGFAAATEGLGASLGPKVAEAMRKYPFAQKSLSFLKVHAVEDQKHVDLVKDAFNRCAETSEERRELLVTTWRYTLKAYARLFSDALERGNAPDVRTAPATP